MQEKITFASKLPPILETGSLVGKKKNRASIWNLTCQISGFWNCLLAFFKCLLPGFLGEACEGDVLGGRIHRYRLIGATVHQVLPVLLN